MNKCIAIILMVISVSCLSIYAQDAQDNIGKVNNKNETDENTATNDKMKVKDEDGNILLEVTDEGDGGSIYLKPIPTIPSSADKLYNIGSTLYWNGSAMGTAGSAGGWTDDGSVVRLSLSTDKVGIGTTSPSSLLSVGGNGNNFAIISAVAADYQVGLYSIASGTASTGIYGESAEGNAIEGYTAVTPAEVILVLVVVLGLEFLVKLLSQDGQDGSLGAGILVVMLELVQLHQVKS